MNNFPWDQTLVGWIHITSAAAVAGFFFAWLLAIQPSGAETARSVVARFRPWFWAAALLLPLTGAYTWYVRTGQGYPGFYFHIIYTKILLYVALFGIAGMLTKAVRARDGGGRRGLLAACVVLCLVILFMSAFMRRVGPVELAETTRGFAAPGTTHNTLVVTKKGVASGWQD